MSSGGRRVLIGGGSGFLGKEISKVLQRNGSEVILASREGNQQGRISWDEITRSGLPKDCHAVLNVAGAEVMNPLKRWTKSFEKEIVDSRVGTTKILARAIKALGEKHKPKVFVTSAGVSGYPMDGKTYDEEHKLSGCGSFMNNLCKEWEEAAKEAGCRTVNVRVGLVLGNSGGALKQMMIPFKFGLGSVLGDGTQPFPWIHIDDLTGIFVHSIENDSVHGPINAVAPSLDTNYDFTKALGKNLHRPTILPFPSFAVKAVYGEERSELLLVGAKIKPQKALETGYKFKYPDLQTALKQLCN
eukprot:Nk52_evm32s239 gene=Nk52_evmTU32s239